MTRLLPFAAALALSLLLGCGGTNAVHAGADAGPDGGATAGADGGPDGGPGSAIAATPGAWTWVDFPDSSCDDGTPTGLGVNLSATSSNVLVFMNGGGACWDYQTCVSLNTSTHGPYGSAQFNAQFFNGAPGGSILDRAAPGNPVADWSYVFIPYCTGDVHAGDNVITYTSGSAARTFHHKGHANVVAYLKRLLATFPAPGKLALTGASAGGFGALLNFDSFRKTWPAGALYLVDDSGPLLEKDVIAPAIRAAWFSSWGLGPLADPLCGAACHDDLSLVFDAVNARYPGDRKSLLSSQQDQVIRSYLQLTGPQFQAGLQQVATDKLDPSARFHYFFIPGSSHTMLGNPAGFSQGGVTLAAFLARQLGDDPGWTSVKP